MPDRWLVMKITMESLYEIWGSGKYLFCMEIMKKRDREKER